MGRKVVIIGSRTEGLTAASTARALDRDLEICVLTEDEHIAYSPCAIPFVLNGKIKDFSSIIMHDPAFYGEQRNIEVRTKTKVRGGRDG